jgi:hypothetical protein
MAPIVQEGKNLVKFLTNHQALVTKFNAKEQGLELLKLDDTRFGMNFIMLERLLKVKPRLEQ